MLAAVPKGEMKYFDIDPRSIFFREAEKKDQNIEQLTEDCMRQLDRTHDGKITKSKYD
jgi:hypothetical protein